MGHLCPSDLDKLLEGSIDEGGGARGGDSNSNASNLNGFFAKPKGTEIMARSKVE